VPADEHEAPLAPHGLHTHDAWGNLELDGPCQRAAVQILFGIKREMQRLVTERLLGEK
jgi:hypothetical protein